MRVIFAQTTPYLPHESGGALSNTDAMCRLLQRRGIDTEVLCASSGKLMDRLLPARFGSYRIQRCEDPIGAAQAMCSSSAPDLAVVQLGDLGRLSTTFLSARVPTLVYIHDMYTFNAATLPSGEGLLSYAACSSFVAREMRKRLPADPVVLPVLIEPDQYRVETSRSVATFVNPIPRKGSEIVFALAAARPDITFAFVEAWQLRARAWKYLQGRAALHGNIRLLRRAQDMRSVYANSRLVLAPSIGDEAWGRVVSEAQISGIPALASTSGGLPDAVGPGGLVVDRQASVSDWLAALSEIWDDPSRYSQFAERARLYADRADFQPDAVVGHAIELFRSLTSGK